MPVSPFAVGQRLPIMQVQLMTEADPPNTVAQAVDLTGLNAGNFVLNIYDTTVKTDQVGTGVFIIVSPSSQGLIQYAWSAADTANSGAKQLFITANFAGGPLTFDPIPFVIVPK
jgi:hypothetical protein